MKTSFIDMVRQDIFDALGFTTADPVIIDRFNTVIAYIGASAGMDSDVFNECLNYGSEN